MSRRAVMTSVITVILAASAALFTSAASSQPNPPGVDLCTLPVAERAGNAGWFCPVPEEEQRKALSEKVAGPVLGSGPRKAIMPMADGQYGRCFSTGCWYRESGVKAYISVKGWYGYGSTTLGTAHLYTADTINGGQTISDPQWKKTSVRATHSNMWVTERYWASGSSSGVLSTPKRSVSALTASCGGCANSFAPVYLYDYSTGYQTVMHSIRWKDYSYPGWWYINAKSVKMAKRTDGVAGYWFMGTWDDPIVPGGTLASGWYA